MSINCEKVVDNIRQDLREYLTRTGLKSLVIGVSGGIDSALCIALAEPVCKELGVELIGRSLPILTNTKDELHRAKLIGEPFCTNFKEVDLSGPYQAMSEFIIDTEGMCHDGRENKIREGNIKARTRMIYLYNLAYANKGMVLSTDNLTEYNLGFWTLAGDIGNWGMIQNLWKTEVYEVATYLVKEYNKYLFTMKAEALQLCIDATPTDGLGITSSDIEQLGVSNYAEVDEILRKWCERYECDDPTHPIMKRHFVTAFKRNDPYNIPREKLFNIDG